jgi:GNAT superfamily N-acetyltransferase
MDYEFELSKANRLELARVFRYHKRVDLSIDCVLEGQMGKAYVDHLANPKAFRITIGPFWYFSGDAHSSGGLEMMSGFPAYNILMPSTPDWVSLAREIFGEDLRSFPRYTFSAAALTSQHLHDCLDQSPYHSQVIPIDLELAAQLTSQPESFLELSDFESHQDFIDRGMGYTLMDGDKAIGVAYSSLVCSTGIEVSIYVDEPYRRKGAATALASKLLLECLRLGLRPNWDAANPESCKLAQKLGYTFVESYDAYYHTRK